MSFITKSSEKEVVEAAKEKEDEWASGPASYFPSTFEELVEDAVGACQRGMIDGLKKMEVEFPLTSDTSGYKSSSDSFIDGHIQLAIQACKLLSEKDGRRYRVVVPDPTEQKRASAKFATQIEMAGGNVTMGSLSGKKEEFSVFTLFDNKVDTSVPEEDVADVFMVVNASTIELPNVKQYWEDYVGDEKTMILWCLELDTLRADLGLFGFPSKDVHYGFLSGFKPMLYLRQRQYSKSVPIAPFVINYDGALFRLYPAPWQVMLKQDSGELACVAERPKRYALQELKEELLEVVGLNTEEKGSNMEFLRRGYKTSTWWEGAEGEKAEERSDWRW
eukprot:CAMPEP_0196571656 /NCGR_PEP_ID=MMETSP1081-20130531/1801_1 /TAXON_ID=36882 /ORGANISM="Pyramimonas amylifera, Strain CCMP720" /LENGTH=332 /DNA_ID=CAMNT_0041888685 /DNA_START=284 /DNA_END=1279 /DNA_ORIENTATION=-